MTIKFTDTQLVALSAASQRADCCIAPTPQLRGVVATKFAEKLLTAELASEIPASKDMPIWRRNDNGDAIALQLTAAGLAAIGIADESAPAQDDVVEADRSVGAPANDGGVSRSSEPAGVKAASAADPGALGGGDPANAVSEAPDRADALTASRGAPEPRSESKADIPRSGTKLATLIAMLTRSEGATIEEITNLLGWLPHTTRAAITGLRKRDYAVLLDKADKTRGSVYRIRDFGDEGAVHGESARDAGVGGTSEAVPETAGRHHAPLSDAMMRDGAQ